MQELGLSETIQSVESPQLPENEDTQTPNMSPVDDLSSARSAASPASAPAPTSAVDMPADLNTANGVASGSQPVSAPMCAPNDYLSCNRFLTAVVTFPFVFVSTAFVFESTAPLRLWLGTNAL